jgi:DNA replication protein DnaC
MDKSKFPCWRKEIDFKKPFEWLNTTDFDDVDITPTIKALHEYTVNFAENILGHAVNGSGITAMGPPGTGKTLEMGLLFKWACYTGAFRPCHFIYMHDAVSAYSTRKYGEDSDKVKARIKDCRILFIDDVGVEYESDFNTSIAESIFVERYNRKLPTCITTNLSLEEFEKRYGKRVIDRLQEVNKTFILVGDSYRDKIQRPLPQTPANEPEEVGVYSYNDIITATLEMIRKVLLEIQQLSTEAYEEARDFANRWCKTFEETQEDFEYSNMAYLYRKLLLMRDEAKGV